MRIPTGNFGNVVATPQRAVSVSADAFGEEEAQANIQAGATLMRVGSEFEQRQKDLDRIKSVRTMAEAKNDLHGLQDEITRGLADGTVTPDAAQGMWGERSKKLLEDRLKGLNSGNREIASAHLTGDSFTLGARVRDAAIKRTQQDIGGELFNLGSALERDAVRDRGKANGLFEQSVTALGPQAGMTPVQIAKEVQGFKERTARTEAYSLIHSARTDMAALNAAEQAVSSDAFADLDPQQRAVLLNTTAGYKAALEQKAIVAQQRAELQAQRRDREAGAVFNQAWALSLQGKKLSDGFAETLAAKTQGTQYESMVPQLLNAVPEATAFAMQPLVAQREAITLWTAEQNASGTDPVRDARLEAARKSFEASERDYQADPLPAALERGVLPELAPLNMTGGVASIAQGLNARMEQARTVGAQVGRPVSPLTADEAGQFAELLKVLPADQKATTLAALSDAIGTPALGALAKQLDQKDRTLGLMAAYGDMRTSDGGLVSGRLLVGAQAIKDKQIPEADVSMWRSKIAKEIRGTYASAEMEDAVIDAAVLARAARTAEGKGPSEKNAIKDVTGGIIEFNGGRIPLPQGMNESTFEKSLVAITPESLQAQGLGGEVFIAGKSVPIADFVQSLPNAKLRHAGQGVYTVTSGTGSVLDQDGKPVMIRIGNGTR